MGQLDQLKNAPKSVRIDLSDVDSPAAYSKVHQQQTRQLREEIDVVCEDNQKLKDSVKRLRQEKQEAEDIADRLEEKARALIKEKYRAQDDKEEIERQAEGLRRRLKEKDEAVLSAQKGSEKRQHEILQKESKIKRLTSQLRESERRVLETTSMSNANHTVSHLVSTGNLSPFS